MSFFFQLAFVFMHAATLPAPGLLSIIAPGAIACIVGNELLIGYS